MTSSRRLAVVALLLLLTGSQLVAQGHGGGCACGKPATPIVRWEIEHADPAYQRAAAAELARWNRYLNIFQHVQGDGAMQQNGKNEIGFLTIGETRSLYGISIDRDTFGFAFVTPEEAYGDFDECPMPAGTACGTFRETDVIVNENFARGFKAEGPIDFDDNVGPAFYGATLVHELGHTLGFHHNFRNMSVMNYYEDFAAQYIATSDVDAIFFAYREQYEDVLDLAVYPFYFDPRLSTYSATTPVSVSPATVTARGGITIKAVGFENVGTRTASNVAIRFFASADATISADDTLIGVVAFDEEVAPRAFWDDSRRGISFDLPATLSPGTYYIGALVTHSGGATDDVTYNNTWVAPQQLIVTPLKRNRPIRR